MVRKYTNRKYKTIKKCIICGKDFTINSPSQRTCSKECRKKWYNYNARRRNKPYNERFRKSHPFFVRDYYRKNKRELVENLGNKCVMCGLTPQDVDYCYGVFVIDEIKPLGLGKKKFKSLSRKDLEFAKQLFKEGKIQLLCQNCSAIKSWKNNDYAKEKSE